MSEEVFVDEAGDRRMKDTQIVVPVVVGTCAWWLGKKASDYLTHKWTVYMRAANNEDLTHILSKVTFELHHTFTNPHRGVEAHPYEVTEQGWGEFDINITMSFHPDAKEKDVSILHHLKLYESDNAPNTTKKPVVAETYEELVFSEPTEAFYQRVMGTGGQGAHVPKPAADLSCQPWVLPMDDKEEVDKLRECRARVAAMVSELRKEFETAR